MKSIIILFLVLATILKAEIIFDDTLPPTHEEIIDYDSIQNDEINENEDISPIELQKNSQEILEDVIKTKNKIQNQNIDGVAQSQNIYLTVVSIPKKAIVNQRVKVTLKATIIRSDIESINTIFLENKNIYVYNKDEPWKKIDENRYTVDY